MDAIYVQLLNPDGSTSFDQLPVAATAAENAQALYQYRESVWPEGIQLVYSWIDGNRLLHPQYETREPPEYQAWRQLTQGTAALPVPGTALGITGAVADIPWTALGAGAALLLLLLARRKKGA